MFNEIKKTIEWGHDKLTLETGKIARQADSTVIATYGETVVMAAVVYSKGQRLTKISFPYRLIIKKSIMLRGKFQEVFSKEKLDPQKKKL